MSTTTGVTTGTPDGSAASILSTPTKTMDGQEKRGLRRALNRAYTSRLDAIARDASEFSTARMQVNK